MRRLVPWTLLLAFGIGINATAQEAEKLPLHVLYLVRDDEPDRQETFSSFLAEHFAKTSVMKRSEFTPSEVRGADVVLLDWSQRDERPENYPSPLGKLEDWSTPTVLLGSAGLLIAGPWYVIGGAG